jgi:hypothetical protein
MNVDHAVTVGMIVWPLLGLLGIAAVLGVIFIILSVIADGFKH